MKKLNVGCGTDIKKGWINLDFHETYGVDCIFDLNNIFKGKKLPFKDNSFDYVYCSHVLEDFSRPLLIIYELIRITKPKIGVLEIRVPYMTSFWGSIHHVRGFSRSALLNINERPEYGINNKDLNIKVKFLRNFEVNKLSPRRSGQPHWYGLIYQSISKWIANAMPIVYDQTFLKWIFPFVQLQYIIKKK